MQVEYRKRSASGQEKILFDIRMLTEANKHLPLRRGSITVYVFITVYFVRNAAYNMEANSFKFHNQPAGIENRYAGFGGVGNIWRDDDRRLSLDVRLPVRVVVTVLGGMENVGWETSPSIALDVTDVAGLTGWDLGLLAGPIFGTERRHDYFYSVNPRYATPDRPAFDARAGYSGSQFIVSLSKRFSRFWLGAFARWDNLGGAVFLDSPLVMQ